MDLLNPPFLLTAIISGLLIGLTCAYLGFFIILKRIVFISIALSEISALGIALGLFIGFDPTITSFVLTLVGIIFFWYSFSERTVSRENFVGFIYTFCLALSVILIAKNPDAETHGLDVVSGNLLYTNWNDILILIFTILLVLIIHYIFFKEFVFISFDRETASTTGINVKMLDFILYFTIGVMISVSTKIAGVLFVFASLIIPIISSLSIAKRIDKIILCCNIITFFCIILGIWFSYIFDLPTSPTIVVLYSLIFLVIKMMKMMNMMNKG